MKIEKIGIYKIINPKGRVYIGQSIDLFDRWRIYKKGHHKEQPKLHRSFNKYGWENHKFEIIEECSIKQLDEREAFHKQQFIDQFGWSKALFCEIYDTNKGGYKSEETKRKMSESKKGIKYSKEHNENLSKSLKGKKRTQEFKDKIKYNQERKNNISKANKGRTSPMKGKKQSKEWKLKMKKLISENKERGNKISDSLKNLTDCQKQIKINKIIESNSIPIIQYDLLMNPIKEWKSSKEASRSLKIYDSNINCCLKGKYKSSGGFIWKYK